MEESDLKRFIDLYKSFGIELSPQSGQSGEKFIRLQSGEHKFDGYFCFYSEVYFDRNGKFMRQGFWE